MASAPLSRTKRQGGPNRSGRGEPSPPAPRTPGGLVVASQRRHGFGWPGPWMVFQNGHSVTGARKTSYLATLRRRLKRLPARRRPESGRLAGRDCSRSASRGSRYVRREQPGQLLEAVPPWLTRARVATAGRRAARSASRHSGSRARTSGRCRGCMVAVFVFYLTDVKKMNFTKSEHNQE